MRKAFTLLELLAVIGIMALLGVAATSGYAALTTGMRDRGTVAAASAVLRAAKERAHVDRVRTVVFCYNKCIKEAVSEDEVGVVAGFMTAVRIGGRITYVDDPFLYDEFGDLDLCYAFTEKDEEASWKRRGTHRLFRYTGGGSAKMEYSDVSDVVYRDWEDHQVALFSECPGGRTNLATAAFCDRHTSPLQPSSWKIGDAYAFEFSELQLPSGYIFGSAQPPKKAGKIDVIAILEFDPDADSTRSVEIYRTRPNVNGVPEVPKNGKAGEATTDDTKRD